MTDLATDFQRREIDGSLLLVRIDIDDAFARAGLHSLSEWIRLTSGGTDQAGRGRTAKVPLNGGRSAVIKQMRRGGLLAPLWRDRFAGSRRLLENLEIPLRAAAMGIPTAKPLALLLRGGAFGLFQAWLATEEIRGAVDLLSRLRQEPPPDLGYLGRIIGMIRESHETGLSHADLNLGNILVREREDGSLDRCWIIDLDKARLHDRPLPFGTRMAQLRRLERFWVKHLGGAGLGGIAPGELLARLYSESSQGGPNEGQDRQQKSGKP